MNKTVSLNENHLFRRLYRTGKTFVTPYVAMYYVRNNLSYNRLGITVTKKIGNAVQRNRARRIIREALRELEPDLKFSYDIVVVARKRAVFSKKQHIVKGLEKAPIFEKVRI